MSERPGGRPGVNAVVFDLGNVLVRWEPEPFYDARLGSDRRRAFFAETDMHAMNNEIDRGAPFRDTVYAHADRHPDWADEIRLWHDRWDDFVVGPVDGTDTVLQGLRAADMPVFALSNVGIETLTRLEARFAWLKGFDRRYISGAMGLVKPDPAIYAAVEDDSGVPPERLFFIDDKPENIAAAHARGWRTHVFAGADGLSRALHDAGVTW